MKSYIAYVPGSSGTGARAEERERPEGHRRRGSGPLWAHTSSLQRVIQMIGEGESAAKRELLLTRR